jgi:sporulation protein YlmC with PRC-barrel domain
MNNTNQPTDPVGGSAGSKQKLMVSGYISPKGNCTLKAEVRRGMPVLSIEGKEWGKVAGVVLNNENSQATHLLLSRLPEISGYWLVAVDLIAEIGEKKVTVSVSDDALQSLPRWHAV